MEESSDESDVEADLLRYADEEATVPIVNNTAEDSDDSDKVEAAKDERKISNLLSTASPEELFKKYDADDSGFISLKEFADMLPNVGVHISDAKTLRIFEQCDTDKGGEIDIEEFKMALFACDPATGNSLGFMPTALKGPKDAFDFFDEDGGGQIDDVEFMEVLEYMNLDISDENQEKMFLKYDKDKSGYIDYEEFRAMWIQMSDVKRELSLRNVLFPKNAKRKELEQLLLETILNEELMERRSLEEAKWWHSWQLEKARRTSLGKLALDRSQNELALALDAIGQVYMLGIGIHGQFKSDIAARNPDVYEKCNHIIDLWNERVNPTYEKPSEAKVKRLHTLASTDGEPMDTIVKKDRKQMRKLLQEQDKKRRLANMVKHRQQKTLASPKRVNKKTANQLKNSKYSRKLSNKNGSNQEQPSKPDDIPEETDMKFVRSLRFKDVKPMTNTVWLWGKRIIGGAISENVAYVLSDMGAIYTWGGNHAWETLDQDELDIEGQENGTFQKAPLTPRSKALKLCTNEPMQESMSELNERLENERKQKEDAKLEAEYERNKLVCHYFDVWELPPSNSTKHRFMNQVLLKRIEFASLSKCMELRGHKVGRLKIAALLSLAAYSFELEIRIFGVEKHEQIKKQDFEIQNMPVATETVDVEQEKTKFRDEWSELLKKYTSEQEERRIVALEEEAGTEDVKEALYHATASKRRVLQEDPFPLTTAQGTSRLFQISGITSRGPGLKEHRGHSSAWKITAGGHHAAIISHDGALFTWGIGVSGRLGHGCEQESYYIDAQYPKRVQALQNARIKDVSCATRFTIALDTSGKLYSFGAIEGCGVGDLAEQYEQSSPFPLPVKVSPKLKFRQVSCGSSHCGAVTTEGELFMWGNANGGRLGLGAAVTDKVTIPVRVNHLKKHNVWQIACGGSHSILCTAIRDGKISIHDRDGGQLFVCGNSFALGKLYSTWTSMSSMEHKKIEQVSCGMNHSACVSVTGELYTWGQNRNQCTGHPKQEIFVSQPTLLPSFYKDPHNMAYGRPTKQSSIYNKQDGRLAVNGQRDGTLDHCIHTQLDDHGWWEVDLEQPTIISRIRVWNRTDEPTGLKRRKDEFSSRLFPFYVLVSETPFKDTVSGSPNLKMAKEQSNIYHLFTKVERTVDWNLTSAATTGQYIRIQMASKNFLHVAEVEIFGVYSAFNYVGKVSQAICGNEATMVVMKPTSNPATLKDHYFRAVRADADNSMILRQFESYAPLYDQYQRGESLESKKCRLCREFYRCEICTFIANTPCQSLPDTVCGERLGLQRIIEHVLSRQPPPLDWSEEDAALALAKQQVVTKRKKSFSLSKSFSLFQKTKVSPDEINE